jgi:hypothetical protein
VNLGINNSPILLVGIKGGRINLNPISLGRWLLLIRSLQKRQHVTQFKKSVLPPLEIGII